MLRLCEVEKAMNRILFGKVVIEETQNTFAVECKHKDDYYHIKGRFVIDKEESRVIFAFINMQDFIESDRIYPVKEVTKLGRVDHDAILDVLELFKDCSLNFGYSSFIKLKGIREIGD